MIKNIEKNWICIRKDVCTSLFFNKILFLQLKLLGLNQIKPFAEIRHVYWQNCFLDNLFTRKVIKFFSKSI